MKIDLTRAFAVVGSTFKNINFKDEKEVRLIAFDVQDGDPQLRFREGARTIIPFYKLLIVNENKIGIKRIKIGPTINSELSYSTLDQFIDNIRLNPTPLYNYIKSEYHQDAEIKGLDRIQIRRSKIPLRDGV